MPTNKPDIENILTGRQLAIFKLLQKTPSLVSYQKLASIFGTTPNLANLVAVHMRDIRRIFKKHALPYEIEAVRGMGYRLRGK